MPVLKSACHVISPRLRMLLFTSTFSNFMNIILGSSACKDLEASRVRLLLKHAVPSAVQNKSQNRLERIVAHPENLRIDAESFLDSRCIDLFSQPYIIMQFSV